MMTEYVTLEQAATAFAIQSVFSTSDCLDMLHYAIQKGWISPSDVAPVRHGRWVHTEIEDDEEWGGTWHKWTCDNCGYSVGHNPNGTNYCPNCGSKMEGE